MSGFRTEWYKDGWSAVIDNGIMMVWEPSTIGGERDAIGLIDDMCAKYPELARLLIADGVLRISHDD